MAKSRDMMGVALLNENSYVVVPSHSDCSICKCPVIFFRFGHAFVTSSYYHYLKYFSILVSFLCIAAALYIYIKTGGFAGSYPFMIFTCIQTVLFFYLPVRFWTFSHELYTCNDVCTLMEEAYIFDSNINRMSSLLVIVNTLGFFAAAIFYSVNNFDTWIGLFVAFVVAFVYCVIITTGNVAIVLLLLGLSNKIESLITLTRESSAMLTQKPHDTNGENTENSSFNDAQQQCFRTIGFEYNKLHRSIHSASKKWGEFVFLGAVAAVLFTVWCLWSLYEPSKAVQAVNRISLVGYVFSGLLVITEFGCLLVHVNERGKFVSNEVSRLILNHRMTTTMDDVKQVSTIRDMLILLDCIHFARIEFAFWDNFVLRSRDLVTLVGAIIAGVVPAFSAPDL